MSLQISQFMQAIIERKWSAHGELHLRESAKGIGGFGPSSPMYLCLQERGGRSNNNLHGNIINKFSFS